jgi:hypothetical protein
MKLRACPGLILSGIAVAACWTMAPVAEAQTCNGPGTERWPVKVSLANDANPDKPKSVDLASLFSLDDPPGISHNDSRYQNARIPEFSNSLKVNEGAILQTTGWLYLVATETDDCDYHIQISDKPRTSSDPPTAQDNCIVVEAPRPDFVQNADLKQRVATIRAYIKTKLLKDKEPSNNGSVMAHAVCVQVTGQLFYDDSHLGKNGEKELRGKRGMHSHTLWELHPLVDFKIVPSATCESQN